MMIGLVLTGGGARAAYQAGVLRGIAQICRGRRTPFRVVTGSSGGAINGLRLATGGNDFAATTERLWRTWSELTPGDVFRTDAASIARIGAGWARDLALGGLLDGTSSTYLLDTTPLRRLIAREIDFARIEALVRDGTLHGVAVSATHYGSGAAITFFDGDPSIRPWARGSRVARRTRLDIAHAMASAAIPGFFPAERMEGAFYGDGCIRLTAPLSPAIHLGAERVLAIGVRYPRDARVAEASSAEPMPELTAADVAGVLLNAVFLDSLEADLERLERINRTLELLETCGRPPHPDALRRIPALAIAPSVDLGALAGDELRHLPRTLAYMLRGIGAYGERGSDLVSYLAFDSAYTRPLLDLGLRDAWTRAHQIRDFLSGGPRLAARAG